jgi:ABC-2 type transport system permease protein
MTAIRSNAVPAGSARTIDTGKRMPFPLQLTMLTWRALVINLREPFAVIPGIFINIFFLLIFQASLGGATNFIPGLSGDSYVGFILPFSVASAALSGAGIAGQSIVRDIERGYFDKLMLTPVSRVALLLAPMLATSVTLAVQTGIVIGVAVLLGLDPVTGIAGVLAVMGIALLLGIGFSGFNVAVALYSGSSAATQGVSFLFFPLSFLTPTFVPLSLLTGWLRTAASINPITYIIEAMRAILNTGWETEIIARGIGSCLLLGGLMLSLALLALRARTRRR